MDIIQIKKFIRGFNVNALGICIKKDKQFYSLSQNEELVEWGIKNKLLSQNDNSYVFNYKNIYKMMKTFDLTVKIFKNNVSEYSSPINTRLDHNSQFGYKMIIIYKKKIVSSLELNACDYDFGTDYEIKKEIFQTFNMFSEKYLFLIMFYLSKKI